jgi:hypothetical protein
MPIPSQLQAPELRRSSSWDHISSSRGIPPVSFCAQWNNGNFRIFDNACLLEGACADHGIRKCNPQPVGRKRTQSASCNRVEPDIPMFSGGSLRGSLPSNWDYSGAGYTAFKYSINVKRRLPPARIKPNGTLGKRMGSIVGGSVRFRVLPLLRSPRSL